MSGLGVIFKKEMKEMLRDPRIIVGMIIVPLIIFPLMGSAFSLSTSEVEKKISKITIAVWDEDSSNLSRNLTDYLKKNGIDVEYVSGKDLNDSLRETQKMGLSVLIHIPKDYSAKINNFTTARIEIYMVVERYDITESGEYARVMMAVEEYSEKILADRVSEVWEGNSTEFLNPINTSGISVVNGNVVKISPDALIGFAMSQTYSIPIVLMVMLIMAIQLAATSVAMEKEGKTLETLLSMPVKRSHILAGKIFGVIVIALIATMAYFGGYMYYMNTILSEIPTQGFSFSISPLGIGLVAITLFLTLLSGLSLAMLLAVMCDDVRSAQSLIGVIYIPIIIPMFMTMLMDVSSLPTALKIFVLAIPFSYPMIAGKALYTGNYFYVLIGIPYLVIFTTITIFVAARLFNTEKIFTMKLKFQRGLRR